jgi:hypothetical protein
MAGRNIMPVVVENVQLHGTRKAIIPATTNINISAAIEIRDLVNYTFTSSTLGVGEEIVLDIYDFSLSEPTWQPYMLNGGRVKLAKDYEQLQLSASSVLVRFIKTATAAPVGLTMSHR